MRRETLDEGGWSMIVAVGAVFRKFSCKKIARSPRSKQGPGSRWGLRFLALSTQQGDNPRSLFYVCAIFFSEPPLGQSHLLD